MKEVFQAGCSVRSSKVIYPSTFTRGWLIPATKLYLISSSNNIENKILSLKGSAEKCSPRFAAASVAVFVSEERTRLTGRITNLEFILASQREGGRSVSQ
jgi:hypothetical protein